MSPLTKRGARMRFLILCVVFSVTIATHNAASIGQSGTANEGQTATKENLRNKLQEWFRALGSEKQERRDNELNVDGQGQEETEQAPLSGQDKKEVLANKLQGLLKASLKSMKTGETKRGNGHVKTGAVDRRERERLLLQKIKVKSGRALSRNGDAAMFQNRRGRPKSIRNTERPNLKNARQPIQRGFSGVGKMAERSGRRARGQKGQVQQKRMNVFGARDNADKTARRNFRRTTSSSFRQMKVQPSSRATGISKSHNTRAEIQKESVNRKQTTRKRQYFDSNPACDCYDLMYDDLMYNGLGGYSYDPDLDTCYIEYGNATGAYNYCYPSNDYTYSDPNYLSCDSCYYLLYDYYSGMYMYDDNVYNCEMEWGHYYGEAYDSYCYNDYYDYNYDSSYTDPYLTCDYCYDIINGNINDYSDDWYACEMYYSSCPDYSGYSDGGPYYPTNEESWGGTYNTSCDVPCMMEYGEAFYVCLLVEIYESTQELGEYSYMAMYVSPERYDEATEKINNEMMMHKPTDSGTGYDPYILP